MGLAALVGHRPWHSQRCTFPDITAHHSHPLYASIPLQLQLFDQADFRGKRVLLPLLDKQELTKAARPRSIIVPRGHEVALHRDNHCQWEPSLVLPGSVPDLDAANLPPVRGEGCRRCFSRRCSQAAIIPTSDHRGRRLHALFCSALLTPLPLHSAPERLAASSLGGWKSTRIPQQRAPA